MTLFERDKAVLTMQRQWKKKAFVCLLSVLAWTASAGKVSDSCTYNGILLHGKVKIVRSFADIKVQPVRSFADLKVQTVHSFPSRCGQWQFVESFPDFTISFVESFADIKVQFVHSFPGVP